MKKKILGVLLTVIMVTSLVACGGSDTSEAPSGEASADSEESSVDSEDATGGEVEPVEITYTYWADKTEYSQLMQDIIAKFNETNESGITVIGEEMPWDGGAYSENLFNAAMGGGQTDTAAWKLTATPLFYNNDLLADLTPYINEWDMKDDIDENMFEVMKSASGTEEIYVMPWNTQILYVYYRPSYFEQAGIEVPTTYEEFLTAIEKCTMDTDGDGKTDVYGFGMRGSNGGQEPWGNFIHGTGGSFDDLTSEEAIAGMQDYTDVYTNGYAPATAVGDGFNEIIAGFQSGLTAMTVHHTGSSAGMVEIFGDDVSAFAFPAGDGQWTSMGDTENVIFESCENKEAAFEWISYLATGEGQQMWCEGTGNVPVSKTVQETEFFQNDRFMKASFDGQSYAGVIPIKDTTTEWVSSVWPNTISQALTEDITAEECMAILEEELNK